MGILIIGLGALLLGFLLILLISVTAPRDEGPVDAAGVPEGAHAWLARLSAEDLGTLLEQLFVEMKFEIQDLRVGGRVVDLFAVNPTPITGGRVYVRGISHPPLGIVGEDEVRIALETARAELSGKALVATGGVFSPEALSAAKGAPLELIDGPTLLGLVKKHLPPVAVARRV